MSDNVHRTRTSVAVSALDHPLPTRQVAKESRKVVNLALVDFSQDREREREGER